MSEQKTKVIYSGCEHDPEETSKCFCWQCRIAELEAQITEIPTLCRKYEKRIAELEAENRRLEGTIDTIRIQYESLRQDRDQVEVSRDELQAKLDAVNRNVENVIAELDEGELFRYSKYISARIKTALQQEQNDE